MSVPTLIARTLITHNVRHPNRMNFIQCIFCSFNSLHALTQSVNWIYFFYYFSISRKSILTFQSKRFSSTYIYFVQAPKRIVYLTQDKTRWRDKTQLTLTLIPHVVVLYVNACVYEPMLSTVSPYYLRFFFIISFFLPQLTDDDSTEKAKKKHRVFAPVIHGSSSSCGSVLLRWTICGN